MKRCLLLYALLAVGLGSGPLFAQDGAETELRARSLHFEVDGFSLSLQNQVQFRLTFKDERAQSGNGGSNGRDFINFAIPRARMRLNGHIFADEFQYNLRLNWARPGSQILEIAHFRWALFPSVNFNAGQAKVPWNWEERVESISLHFQERSYVNEVFNQGYGKGVWIDGSFGGGAPWLKYWVGVYNGVLKSQEDFRNADITQNADAFSAIIDAEIMINARLETHPLGEVARTMHDPRPEEEYDKILFAFGLGATWFSSGLDNADLRGDTSATSTGSGRSRTLQSTWAVTLDGHFRFMGISVDAGAYWRYTDFHNRGINSYDPSGKQGIGDLEDFGWSFEVAYNLQLIELVDATVGFRVNSVDADEFWGANAALQQTDSRQRAIRPDAMEYGFTASYYLKGKRLKFSLDILYVDQQLAFSYDGSSTLLGVYNEPLSRNAMLGATPESADHDVQWIIRMQVQWIF